MAKSYLEQYDPSGFNAGVAAVAAIQEQANQAALQLAREKAQEEAEVRRAQLQLQNNMAEYAAKKRQDLADNLALAHDPSTWRQNQMDALGNRLDALTKHNNAILDDAAKKPGYYKKEDIQAVNDQNKQIGQWRQGFAKWDKTQLLPDLPQPPDAIVPSLSPEESARQQSKDTLVNARAAQTTARTNRMTGGGLTPREEWTFQKTAGNLYGAYNEWQNNAPKYPGQDAVLARAKQGVDNKSGHIDPTPQDLTNYSYLFRNYKAGDVVAPEDIAKLNAHSQIKSSDLGISGNDKNAGAAAIKFEQAAQTGHMAMNRLLASNPQAQTDYEAIRKRFNGATNVMDFHRMLQTVTEAAKTDPSAQFIARTFGVSAAAPDTAPADAGQGGDSQ